MLMLCDLRDLPVRTPDGKTLGRVHEVHCDKGRIVALMTGPASLIERWTSRGHAHRIAWERVRKVEKDHILVDDEKPKRSSATRSRQGTRRPSGRPSKR